MRLKNAAMSLQLLSATMTVAGTGVEEKAKMALALALGKQPTQITLAS